MMYVNDGDGGWRVPETSDEITAYIENVLEEARQSRLDRGYSGLRKDAIGLRGIVMAPDPKWVDATSPNWRESGLTEETLKVIDEMMQWACDEFGQKLIPGYSVHLDEHSVQIQTGMIPMRDDLSLDQKFFFKGPDHFRVRHQQLHQRLIDTCGYEARLTVSDRSTESLSTKGYEALMDETREEFEKTVALRQETEAKMADLVEREQKLAEDKAITDRREVEIREILTRESAKNIQAQREVEEKLADITRREAVTDHREHVVAQREREQRRRQSVEE